MASSTTKIWEQILLFEQPLPSAGWIYPCSLGDLGERLSSLPGEDLEGLHAVGLVPSSRKDFSANARYYFGSRPRICVYSYPESLTIKLRSHTKKSDTDRWFAVEQDFGMTITQCGSRWLCKWDKGSLRRFILEEVLPHEVGHHVYHHRRCQRGYTYRPFTRECEQFAEAYAANCRRARARVP